MNMLKKHFERYCYNGYSKDVFRLYQPQVVDTNLQLLKQIATLMVGLMFITLVLMIPLPSIRRNFVFYLLSELVGLGLLLLCHIHLQRNPRFVMPVLYAVNCLVYISTLFIGVWNNPTMTSTLFCGVQMVMSLLILDYPLRINLLNFLACVTFGLCSTLIKPPEVSCIDVTNSLGFFLVGQMMMFRFNKTRLSQIITREDIVRQRDTDELTHLSTRAAAERGISSCLFNHGAESVMMLLDLDKFKHLNDTMGHQAGDRVLKEVSADMMGIFRTSDYVSRLGGDEFIIFLKDCPSPAWALNKAQQVVDVVHRTLDIRGKTCVISVSVGVALYGEGGKSYEELYHSADQAMYRAKSQGGNCAVLWDASMQG